MEEPGVHGDSPGKNTGVGSHFLLQGIFPTQGSSPGLLHCRWSLYHLSHQGSPKYFIVKVKSLSRVRLFATPWTVTYHAPPSMGFSRQEYWSGLPFPPPGDLPDLGIKPMSPCLLHCRKRSLLVICFMYSKIVVCVC